MSESKSIQQKFVEAWNDCDNPPLDGKNPHFGNRYATLKATLEEVRKACKAHGIAYMQSLHNDHEDNFYLCSMVTDGESELRLSEFPVSTNGNAQQFGSEMTYRKRQQAQADWGIVGEEDDDGEAATQAPQQQSERKASANQVKLLDKLLKGDQLQNVLNYYHVQDVAELTVSQASSLISQLKG